MLDGNVLLRQERDEVPEGTLSCPYRTLADYHRYRHFEGLRLLPSAWDEIIIQQTLFIYDGKKVTLRKNVRTNGKKIADKTWVLTAYDTSASDGSSAITATNKGKAAPATDENCGKGTNNPSNGQEKEKETAQSVENKGKSQTPQGKAQPEEVQPKEKEDENGNRVLFSIAQTEDGNMYNSEGELTLFSGDFFDNQEESSIFVPTNEVPKNEIAVAKKEAFKVRVEGNTDENIFVFSANYLHLFYGEDIVASAEIEGNIDFIRQLLKDNGRINEITGAYNSWGELSRMYEERRHRRSDVDTEGEGRQTRGTLEVSGREQTDSKRGEAQGNGSGRSTEGVEEQTPQEYFD